MRITFIIFDGITWLDLSGAYEPVSRLRYAGYLPDLTWDFCAFTSSAEDQGGLKIIPNQIQNDLSVYDAVIIPGGRGTRKLMRDTSFLEWIKTAQNIPLKISVCTGSLILGAAGFLQGKKATTHFDAYELLAPFCDEVVESRIVEDGDCITAGAVSSSIDLDSFYAGNGLETRLILLSDIRWTIKDKRKG